MNRQAEHDADRRAVVPLALAAATAQALLVVMAPSLAAVAHDLDAGVGTVGQARTVTAVVALATSLVLLRVVAAAGARRLLVGGVVTALTSTLVVPSATGPAPYLLAHVLVGLALAALLTTAFAGLATVPAGSRGAAAGWVTAAGGAGWVVGSPAAGLLTEHLSWRASHLVPAALALATLVRARSLPAPPRRYAVRRPVPTGRRAGRRGRRWVLAETLANVAWASVLTYVGAFLVVGLGADVAAAGWSISAGAACFVGSSLLGGHLAGRADPRTLVVVTTGLLGPGVVLLFGATPSGAGPAAPVGGAVAFAGCATLAGLRIPATTILGMAQRPDRPGSMMAARTAAMQAGYLLGAALSGAVVALGGWRALGPVLAVVLAASAALTTRLARPGPAAIPVPPDRPVRAATTGGQGWPPSTAPARPRPGRPPHPTWRR